MTHVEKYKERGYTIVPLEDVLAYFDSRGDDEYQFTDTTNCALAQYIKHIRPDGELFDAGVSTGSCTTDGNTEDFYFGDYYWKSLYVGNFREAAANVRSKL